MSRKQKPPGGCVLIGRWRIIAADLWDRDFDWRHDGDQAMPKAVRA